MLGSRKSGTQNFVLIFKALPFHINKTLQKSRILIMGGYGNSQNI